MNQPLCLFYYSVGVFVQRLSPYVIVLSLKSRGWRGWHQPSTRNMSTLENMYTNGEPSLAASKSSRISSGMDVFHVAKRRFCQRLPNGVVEMWITWHTHTLAYIHSWTALYRRLAYYLELFSVHFVSTFKHHNSFHIGLAIMRRCQYTNKINPAEKQRTFGRPMWIIACVYKVYHCASMCVCVSRVTIQHLFVITIFISFSCTLWGPSATPTTHPIRSDNPSPISPQRCRLSANVSHNIIAVMDVVGRTACCEI